MNRVGYVPTHAAFQVPARGKVFDIEQLQRSERSDFHEMWQSSKHGPHQPERQSGRRNKEADPQHVGNDVGKNPAIGIPDRH